jgi:uncharacterized repeat protein (TIGR01451 family)
MRIGLAAALSAALIALAVAGAGGGSAAAAPAPRADLGVGISDNPDPVGLNAPLSYTVSVTNWGPNPARDVTVVDKLPNGYLASAATPSTGTCKVSGRTVSCKLGTIGVGTAATVPTVVISGTAAQPGRITDTASVSSPTVDPVHGNDLATESTRVEKMRARACDGVPATIVGTQGPDRLVGTRGNDVVVALGGDDVIRTFSGEDLICAGKGRDRVRAGIWADRVFGGPGADRLLGGGGRDRLAGNGGADVLLGQGSADVLLGGSGFDACRGGRGTDRLSGCQRRRP